MNSYSEVDLISHIKLNCDAISEFPENVSLEIILALKNGIIRGDLFWKKTMILLLTGAEGFENSWLLGETQNQYLVILEIFQELLSSPDFNSEHLIDIIFLSLTSDSLHSSFDLHHHLVDLFLRNGLKLNENRSLLAMTFIKNATNPVFRSKDELLFQESDGIDHVFPIPENFIARCRIIEDATSYKRRQNKVIVLDQLLKTTRPELCKQYTLNFTVRELKDVYNSQEALKFIQIDSQSESLNPLDYLVAWSEIVAVSPAYSYTIAEILRMILLDSNSAFPDRFHRSRISSFYKQCLRLSTRAVFGLKAGVFHVEHGSLACPSFVYFGRGSVLGKGCIIDTVGGALIGKGAFLGGGFMPILIHTHKHAGGVGVRERSLILPAIFQADAYSRLPMQAIGLFETHDFIGKIQNIQGSRG